MQYGNQSRENTFLFYNYCWFAVLLSVVDHYNRVAKDTSKRVVGVLLGSRSKMDSSGAAKGEFSEESTAEEKENFAHLSTNTDGEAGRNDEEEEDVGTALNEEGGPGTVVDITNAFAVPFEEDSRESSIWYLDHNYLEDMYAMFRKVQCKLEHSEKRNVFANCNFVLFVFVDSTQLKRKSLGFTARGPKSNQLISKLISFSKNTVETRSWSS